ncbi:hypothetical protein FIC_01917 [Flavobacteriaceae bacterium 3519-10]|nr:hypothetical protein FIC_01917 [Flavobacteriaceae bacterium 3519-10]
MVVFLRTLKKKFKKIGLSIQKLKFLYGKIDMD